MTEKVASTYEELETTIQELKNSNAMLSAANNRLQSNIEKLTKENGELKSSHWGITKIEEQLFQIFYELSNFDSEHYFESFEKILSRISHYLGLEQMYISEITEDQHTTYVGINNGKPAQKQTLPLKDTICNLTINSNDIYEILNLPEDTSAPSYIKVLYKDLKYYIGIPIHINHYVFGTLCGISSMPKVINASDQQIMILKSLSNWFSKIIEHQQVQLELKKTVQDLKQSNSDLERFNYIASHDLKEPLNSIVSIIDLIRMEMEASEPQQLKMFDILETSTMRMKSLINDLLSHSLLDKGALVLESIQLDHLLKLVLQDLRSSIERKQATINFNNLPVIRGELTQIKLLFQNLINNAIKYNRRKPMITIYGFEEEEKWVFSVEDNGIGIAKKDYEKVFELFNKLHPKAEYPGSGIGLANCKRIVNRHGGSIWIDSQLGVGSKITFTIAK